MQHRITSLVLVGLLAVAAGPGIFAADDVRSVAETEARMRGDVDGDGALGLSDVVELLAYLFEGGAEPGCLAAADFDGDGVIGVEDVIGLLAAVEGRTSPGQDLLGETAPPSPTVNCDEEGSSTPQPLRQRYTLFHNGNVCIVAPCPVWTITDEEGNAQDITHLDYSRLGLTPAQAARMEERLSEGLWEVVGVLRTEDHELYARRITLELTTIVGLIFAPLEND